MLPEDSGTGRNLAPLLIAIAGHVTRLAGTSDRTRATARLCLMDALTCAFGALQDPACTALLGPVVPGATMAGGARVPGTSYELDPVQAAFNLGMMFRWPGGASAWTATAWGHPADSLGGILAVADWLARRAVMEGRPPLTVSEVLTTLIRACEIQGAVAEVFGGGGDHGLRARVATAAVVTAMVGGTRAQRIGAVWQACREHGAPQTGILPRWVAGDASARGVRLALLAATAEPGDPPVLSQEAQSVRGVMEGVLPGFDFPVVAARLASAAATCFGSRQGERVGALFADLVRLETMPVTTFMACLVKN